MHSRLSCQTRKQCRIAAGFGAAASTTHFSGLSWLAHIRLPGIAANINPDISVPCCVFLIVHINVPATDQLML
jgi:hypothetical protein